MITKTALMHWTQRQALATRAREVIRALGLEERNGGWRSYRPSDDAKAIELVNDMRDLLPLPPGG